MSLICTDTLVGNLRLWSVISNESSWCKIGHVEKGMKHKSYDIYSIYLVVIAFCKFSVTVIFLTHCDIINS